MLLRFARDAVYRSAGAVPRAVPARGRWYACRVPNVGPWELVILVLVLLLVFGARRLPEIGRSMGKGMREFKDSLTGKDAHDEIEPPSEVIAKAVEEDEEAPVESRDRSA